MMKKILLGLLFLNLQVVQGQGMSGQEVYDKWCHECHMDSPFAPGTIQLKQTRGEDLALIKNRRPFPREYTSQIVRSGIGGMPLFRKTEITDTELNRLADYMATN